MTPVASIRNVVKVYTLGRVTVTALRGVTFDIPEGEFLSVVGPSGSGKTTLLNLLGCVDTPTTGIVEIAGQDAGRLSERALTDLRLQYLGFIFQSFNLVPVLSVYENVELPLLLLGTLSSVQRKLRIDGLLDQVGLRDHARHRPPELSGGQRQRVAIARALVTRPRIVLADEPTANLDSATGQNILDIMREINRTQRTTFVFSTHDPRVVASARIVQRLCDGRVVEDVVSPHETGPALASEMGR